jgi:hypothetical protein
MAARRIARRRIVAPCTSTYTRWDKPQQQYQKRLLRAEAQLRLALDDPLNDELSSQLSGMSGFLK